MAPSAELVDALRRQQLACAALGSHYYASLIDLIVADVEAGGPCAQ